MQMFPCGEQRRYEANDKWVHAIAQQQLCFETSLQIYVLVMALVPLTILHTPPVIEKQ